MSSLPTARPVDASAVRGQASRRRGWLRRTGVPVLLGALIGAVVAVVFAQWSLAITLTLGAVGAATSLLGSRRSS